MNIFEGIRKFVFLSCIFISSGVSGHVGDVSSGMALSEEDGIRRVRAHLLLEDNDAALREAQELFTTFPSSRPVGSTYVEALASNGFEIDALKVLRQLSLRYPDLIQDRYLLEELSWSVLSKGLQSSQYAIRLASLIGAYLTHDVRAVKILQQMMRDSNAVIRSVAVQMAPSFGDAVLKDEIVRLMAEEKIWFVRLEVIKAAGTLRMKELSSQLKTILSSEKNTIEERHLAISALVTIYDQISPQEITALAQNNRSGMRQLACQLAAYFQVKEAQDDVIRLVFDPNPNVRIAALNAVGLVYGKDIPRDRLQEIATKSMNDSDPPVSITAAWLMATIDPQASESTFIRWIQGDLPEYRRLAAGALAATGGRCVELEQRLLQESTDPYVRLNIALGLAGQRVENEKCCDIIFDRLTNEKRMWMWDNRSNPLFQVLSPSQVRHIDQIPNYPEAIDQMTRLNLVSVMAILEDPRAQDALKSFLQKKSWGVTGVAAALLLQEGDAGALEMVRGLLEEDRDANVRLQACLVLSMLGHDESVIFDLQKAYVHSDHEQKLQILESLGHIGSTESLPFLVGVFEEPFQILRVAAAACMIQSLNH